VHKRIGIGELQYRDMITFPDSKHFYMFIDYDMERLNMIDLNDHKKPSFVKISTTLKQVDLHGRMYVDV